MSAFSASSQPSSTVASSTDGSRAGDAPVGSDVAADGEAPAMPEGLSKVEQMKVRTFGPGVDFLPIAAFLCA